ncbi:WXG100 family type VII secretion target [Herbiconiux sp. L3-i23]|uniref:WXG100 family type VII secretion target n=1 Tax=Herbiconiux sp. L3-i23 TaxID=2905871 RepID=UPI00204835DB|nr:WXG100 family type VII secretion target [Herbiconiux sp. L3-i23]BDI21815.1 hypothetical protein L3i23_05910 [Herbiconiux sp. L3-i23]
MADWIGQNPDEVNDLAALFDTKAGELESLVQAISAKLAGTTWQGPDRTRFETQDWTNIQTNLNQAAQVLRDTGTVARNNATEQVNASA